MVSVQPNHITVQFEKFLYLQEAVSTDLGIWCDHPQVPTLALLTKESSLLVQVTRLFPEKTPTKRKRAELDKSVGEQPAKKARSASQADVEFLYQEPDLPYKFHSVDEQWQRNICEFMGLRFRRPNKVSRGGPNVPLGPPDLRAIKPIAGDGNCFFRFILYIITRSKLQHMDVRRVILDHMKFIDYYPAGYTSAEQYIQATRMDKFGTWGTDTDMVTLAHMLQTCIFSYNTEEHT